MPEVSVLINCLNEAKHLRETLDSVFSQTFSDWEIVFWDNGSSDRSGEIATSYGEQLRYFRSDTTVPLGRARKSAYEQTKGDFVAILDADDIWLPEKLERQMGLFRANRELGMAFCDTTYFDDAGDRYRHFQLQKPHRGSIFGHALNSTFILSSAMMFRRESLERLGCGFDDQYSRAQDFDLSLRMAYNYPADYVDAPLVKWRMNEAVDKPWKQALVPRAVEIKIVLENLVQTYPEILVKYGAELRECHTKLDYLFAVTEWQGGNSSEARRYLQGHLERRKFTFVYLCTYFLPFSWFLRLSQLYRKAVTSFR